MVAGWDKEACEGHGARCSQWGSPKPDMTEDKCNLCKTEDDT